jgi:hypothetical protein
MKYLLYVQTKSCYLIDLGAQKDVWEAILST